VILFLFHSLAEFPGTMIPLIYVLTEHKLRFMIHDIDGWVYQKLLG
jgi:hypothetical protein